MKLIILILWFLILNKILLFWLWLWQMKEYHLGRMKAHFETQKISKIVSSFWRIKFPKFTKKILFILFSGIILEVLIPLFIFSLENEKFYFWLLILFVLSPVIFSLLILLFQIPTSIWKKRTLKKAARKIEKFKNLLVIGITGSYGKTSTKEFLTEILSEEFRVLKTKKHVNAEIGIAQTILQELKPEHQIFIVEIGAYEKGKIKEVCKMIKPKIGILTGINEQHLSTFGSLENIIKAKYELIESLPGAGLAIFNGSDVRCQKLYKRTKIPKKITLSSSNTFQTIVKNLLPWDIDNFLMAAAAADFLGMNEKEIIEALKNIKSQFRVERGVRNLKIINSTYSANPNSVIAHLDFLKTWSGKKILVMPCLIELGKMSERVHQKIGDKIGKVCDLAIITTKDRFKEIRGGAKKAGMSAEKILFLADSDLIFEQIKNFCASGDIILLESRVPPKLLSLLGVKISRDLSAFL